MANWLAISGICIENLNDNSSILNSQVWYMYQVSRIDYRENYSDTLGRWTCPRDPLNFKKHQADPSSFQIIPN